MPPQQQRTRWPGRTWWTLRLVPGRSWKMVVAGTEGCALENDEQSVPRRSARALASRGRRADSRERALKLARVLASRYPERPSTSYISALSWTAAFGLSELSGEDRWAEKARLEMQPFLEGEPPAIAEPYRLTSLAALAAFSDLGELAEDAAASALAAEAAELILPLDADEIVRFATEWTDDMFMAHLAPRTGRCPLGRGPLSAGHRAPADGVRRASSASGRHIRPLARGAVRLGTRQWIRGAGARGSVDVPVGGLVRPHDDPGHLPSPDARACNASE